MFCFNFYNFPPLVSERNSDPSLVDEKNGSLTELDSPPDFILQPTEPNKTSQTLVSIGRSRKSLIFDSIDTTPDITPAEESLTSNSLRAATPNVEAVISGNDFHTSVN